MFMDKDKKYMFLTILILVGILVIVNSFSYAKYISNSVWNYYLKAKGFYLTSDDLDDNNTLNTNNAWDGSRVHFNIKNSLNEKVMTEYDINYEVSCSVLGDESETTNCYLNGTSSNEYEGILSSLDGCSNNTDDGVDTSLYDRSSCEISGYTWEKQIGVKDMYFEIINNDGEEINDVTVNITVTSTAPYSKTISGDFKLHRSYVDDGNINSIYKSNDGYGRLTISNSYSENKCVSILFDSSKLRADIKTEDINSYNSDGDGYINEMNITIPSKNSISIIFYELNDEITYSQSDFTVDESLGC